MADVPTPGEVKEVVVVAALSCVASAHFRLRRPQILLPSHASARGACPSSLGRQREGLVQQRDLHGRRWPVFAMPLLERMVMGGTWPKAVKEAVVPVVAEG